MKKSVDLYQNETILEFVILIKKKKIVYIKQKTTKTGKKI